MCTVEYTYRYIYIYRERERESAEISSPAALSCAMPAPPILGTRFASLSDSLRKYMVLTIPSIYMVLPNWLVKKPWLIVVNGG